MTPNPTFDNLNTASKENMRRTIRHALTQKSTSKFPNIDIHAELWEKPQSVTAAFCDNFRKAGGKLIVCDRNTIVEFLYKLIAGQKYATILNTSQIITPLLQKSNLNFFTYMDIHQQVDVATIYSDILIARTGSMVFTQNHSLYPSIKNISKNIIVVAFEKNIVLDLKDAFVLQKEKNQGKLCNFSEVITPTKPQKVQGEEEFTPLQPRFILLLIQ